MSPQVSEIDICHLAEMATHQPVKAVVPVGIGATSYAWRVDCVSDTVIVRTIRADNGRPVTYRSEFTILHKLRQQAVPVPEPLLCYSDVSDDLLESLPSAWAVTRQLSGVPLKGNPITPRVAEALADILFQVHRLPVSDYGRLVEDPRHIQGQQQNHLQGILARWCWATLWPFDNTDLADHPISRYDPQLSGMLHKLTASIQDIAQTDQVGLVHADLHGEHIFVNNNRLSGLIDFGAAFISVPGWDFAVLAYYYGWEAAQHIYHTYIRYLPNQRHAHLWLQIYLLAIVIGLYKLQKADAEGGQQAKANRAADFVKETLWRHHDR